MKYLAHVSIAIVTIVNLGFVLPSLFSSAVTGLVILGAVILILNFIALWFLYFEKIRDLIERLKK